MSYLFGVMVSDIEAADGTLLLYSSDTSAQLLDERTLLPTLPLKAKAKDSWMRDFIRGHNDRTRYHLEHQPTSRPIAADML